MKEIILNGFVSVRGNIGPSTLKKITQGGINVSAYKLKCLNLLNELNTIVITEDIYTFIINNEKLYDQSTYGDIESFSATCETPMCIGGWFVQFGGQVAYDFKEIFGYNRTAAILHLNKYPDCPVLDFNSSNQKAARNYVAMMAAFEKRTNKDESFDSWVARNLNG